MPNIHTFLLVFDLGGNAIRTHQPIDLLCPNGVTPKVITTGIYLMVDGQPTVEVQDQGPNTKIFIKIWNCDNSAFELVDATYTEVINLLEYPCPACQLDSGTTLDCQIGSIEIRNGLADGIFTDLATAISYVQGFSSSPLSKTHIDVSNDIFYFQVAFGTSFNSSFLLGSTAQFIDTFGLVTSFGNQCFKQNTANNIFANNISFATYSFAESTGNNTFGNGCIFADDTFFLATGDNTFGENTVAAISCFRNTSGNYLFGNNTTMGNDCFSNSSGNNTFKGTSNFNHSCFSSSIGSNNFKDGICTVGDDFFINSSGDNIFTTIIATNKNNLFFASTGNNRINGLALCGNLAFANSQGNNFIGELNSQDKAFQSSMGSNYIMELDSALGAFSSSFNSLAKNRIDYVKSSSGNFANGAWCTFILDQIGKNPSADLAGSATFFIGSTSKIIVPIAQATSNGGGIEGDLQNAISNGAAVHFILP